MSEPFLYLEDLVKAETPAPSPKAKAIASGVPKTPKPSSKAQAIASGPAKVGDVGLPAPPAQQTLSQGSRVGKVPAVAPAAKAAAQTKYEYWSGTGAPPSSGNWERGPEGGWRRPVGAGGGGTGETENLLQEMKTPAQEAKDQTAAQQAPKTTVSSGAGGDPVSSSAASIEQAKRAQATPPVSEGAKKVVEEKKSEDQRKAAAKRNKEMEAQAKKEAKEAKAAAKDGKKPEATRSADEISLEADTHRETSRQMLDKVQQFQELEQDPARKEQLDRLISVLQKQSEGEGVPSEEDQRLLQASQKAMKTLDKFYSPQIKEQQKQQAEQEKQARKAPPKVNYGRLFDQARAAGEQVGGAAATLEGGGELGASAINYTSSGAVRGGHHLLGSKGEKKATETATKKAPKKGAEVEQSSMKTEKSLGIYLDLQKAIVNSNNPHGHSTPSEDRARIKHEASYAKRPVGVANEGIVTEDDEDKGKDWKHADEDSVQTSVNQKLEAKEKDGKKEEEEEVTKALTAPNPVDMLKSFNSEVREELRRVLPTDLESTFMIEVLDYDPILVSKGQAYIKGKDRHRFNEWAHDRLAKSISSLHERVGLHD